MEGANDKLTLAFADELRQGLKELNPDFVERAVSILPAGAYIAALLELQPHLVVPGSKDDYFAHEQIESWGVDSFWGLAHNPKNEYYRTERQGIGAHAALFEFVVPMFPSRWLNPQTLETYRNAAKHKSCPTALAISILDIKQHYDSDQQHWCWAHYLLDGHHKMKAASEQNATLSLLSFTAVEKGVSTKEQLSELFVAQRKSLTTAPPPPRSLLYPSA